MPDGAVRRSVARTDAWRAPALVLVVGVAHAWALGASWWLAAPMLAVVVWGWLCAAPNLNLANGCTPQLVLAGGFVGTVALDIWTGGDHVWPAGLGGLCWLAWFGTSLELAGHLARLEQAP